MSNNFSFLLGGAWAYCLVAMSQDILGKEAYIARVQDHWVSAPWWLWIFPIFVIYLARGLYEPRQKK